MTSNPARRGPNASDRVVIPLVLAVFAVATVVVTALPGEGATVPVGPAVVSASPTAGLGDGQVVSIRAEVPPGSEIYAIRARLCRHDARIDNTTKFGFQGRMCPVAGIGSGQFDEGYEQQGSNVADLSFAVGIGAITWVNELGYVNELECGPGHPCDLVVQLQLPGDTVYATFGLLLGEGAEPGMASPPVVAADADPPPAAPATDAAAVAPAPVGAGTSRPSKQSGKAAATTDPADGAATADGGNATDDAAAALVASPVSVIRPLDSTRGLRVFSGGIAGIAGGVAIVLIIGRARRRMNQGVT